MRSIPACGWIEAGIHRLPIRVYYEDTDAGGMVYHASHLKFAERARTEMLRCVGLNHGTLRERFGLAFAVRRCAVDYRAPARLDDELMVTTRLLRLGGASLDLEQRVWRARHTLVKLEVRLALLSREARLARMPRELATALATLAAAGGP
jgi:acyl-CoA thioester hydrolase